MRTINNGKEFKARVQIDAIQWLDTLENAQDIAIFLGGAMPLKNHISSSMFMETVNGLVEVKLGSFLVKDINNEVVIYEQDEFLKTFDIEGIK